MRARHIAPVVLAALWLATTGYLATVGAEPAVQSAARPRAWAAPVSKPGLPNLHKVSDDLFRGAQPTAEGFRELKQMGIRTVVNLRAGHSDRDELGDTALGYEHIAMNAWHAEAEDVVRFLELVADKTKTPVFVHCQHGADRTGMVCAAYRIAVQGWSRDEAIREMTRGGFGHHPIFRNLSRFLRELDVQALRKQAGLDD